MKKAFLSFGFILVFALYTAVTRGNAFVTTPTQTPLATTVDNTTTARAGTPPPQEPVPVPTPVSVPVTTKPKPVVQSGMYKNGTYTGPVTDAYYGNVEVQATISGGKLTNVTFLQYPNDRGHSVEVSQYAIPILKQEAIASQSANVNIVSGATQTSLAFRTSLGTALKSALNS